MLIDSINLNHLRIFECVYRTKSMTRASQELHLTQSGVSQHIKSLEDVLSVRLFDRVKQRIIPTEDAHRLYEQSREALIAVERVLLDLKGGEKVIRGNVTLGVPLGFGNHILMPMLAEFSSTHPDVQFTIRYGFLSELTAGLLDGELDFAFIDAFGSDSRIVAEPVFDETLELVCTQGFLNQHAPVQNTSTYFEKLPFVDYQEDGLVLRLWFQHHLKELDPKLKLRATVTDVLGVSRFITAGLAAGIMPGYLIDKLEKSDGVKLHRFLAESKKLTNTIHLATLRERTKSPACNAVLSFLSNRLSGHHS